jgi:hypothetical protein
LFVQNVWKKKSFGRKIYYMKEALVKLVDLWRDWLFPKCQRCEVLEEQLNYERDRVRILLSTISKTQLPEPETPIAFESIKPRRMSWYQKRREMEALKRKQADLTEGEKIFERELNLK